MRKLILETLLLFAVLVCTISCSSTNRYSTVNAHSHNDYLNTSPFVNAYNENFGSIEADVFPVNGVLYVSHKKEEIRPENTFKALYLDPLLSKLSMDSLRQINLLVDIKEEYPVALSLLENELQPLARYLSTPGNTKNITISVSGARPTPAEYDKYPGYIFFDDDLKQRHTDQQWQRISLVSLPFDKISTWTGEGSIPHKDRRAVKHIIDSVHSAGKHIRFWAAPDTEEAWRLQMKLGVDLIGTDKITELANYLKGEEKQ